MDDLGRIERAYGSVAEHNRAREEAESDRYERPLLPTERRFLELRNDYKNQMYAEIRKELTLPVTDRAKAIIDDYNQTMSSLDWSHGFYESRDKSREATQNAMQKVAHSHGIGFHDNVPDVKPERFYVSYEEHGGFEIRHKYSDPMDKETFMQAYTDMYCVCKSLSARYCDKSGDMHCVSNIPLAEIRMDYFKTWGVEDVEQDMIEVNASAKYETLFNQAKAKLERSSECESEHSDQFDDYDDV